MKIHSTQNLNSIRDNITTNKSSFGEVRQDVTDTRYLVRTGMSDVYLHGGSSFKGKSNPKKLIKVLMNDYLKAADKEKWYDKILDHGFFNDCLDFMKHEVFVQSAISCLVCMAMRPATIMALPSKKDKQDNMYASAHSVSSGLVGLISSILIAIPFSKGVKYAQKNMMHHLDTEILKKIKPNLEIESIWKDKAKTIRKPMEEWLDKYGNPFSDDMKNVMKIARPKHISEVSEETFKILGVDVDLAAMRGKPVSEWVDRSGKKIHFNLKDMFIAVQDEGMASSVKGYDNTNFFSLQHIDKDFLKEVMPELDIKSIEKDGKRLHTDFWKDVHGNDFKINLDDIHLSSYNETSNAVPLYTGAKRGNKYISRQTNNGSLDTTKVPDKLGSPIIQDYLDNDAEMDIATKALTWLPDIATRVIVASATIKMIPIILKNIFHLEKKKKSEDVKQAEIKPISTDDKIKSKVASSKEVA
ncbi:hypothetical protein IKQ21_07460 [bacterium]|nr:hypothetical protein [bacterium]